MKTLIIIVNWRGLPDTLRCLDSLRTMVGDFDIIVVDNGSNDGSVEVLERWASRVNGERELAEAEAFAAERGLSGKSTKRTRVPWLRVMALGDNLGFAAANNQALRIGLADNYYDLFWLLNNDTVVTSSALVEVLRYARRRPELTTFGMTVCDLERPEVVQCLAGSSFDPARAASRHVGFGSLARDRPQPCEIEPQLAMISGASMVVRREFVVEVGLMNEDYFLYFEEIDWAVRAGGAFRPGYVRDAIIFHRHGASIGKAHGRASLTRLRYLYRGRLLFTRLYYPRFLLRVRFEIFLEGLRSLKRGDVRACAHLAIRSVSPVSKKNTSAVRSGTGQ